MFTRLVEELNGTETLPVEIPTIRDALVRMGIQDRIVFCSDGEMDPLVLRGLYCQFTRRPTLYGDPERVSLIIYCAKLSANWQRMICCKEMVHILDADMEKTATDEAVVGLLNRLLGPLSTEDFNVFDIMATKDRLALYQSIPILFPMAARERALWDIEHQKKTPQEIADEACLPDWVTPIVLSPQWPELLKDIGC